MHASEKACEENHRLRRTMRDLVALSTLPAVWVGLDLEGIARSLADVLLNTLSLDLIYIRLRGLADEGVVEIARSRHGQNRVEVESVRTALAPLLDIDQTDSSATIPAPCGEGVLHVAVTRFGVGGEHGVLVAGSRNSAFPTEQDRTLLGVGANQTAIVVQRRRAEERLQAQEQRTRTVLESITDAFFAVDRDWRFTYVNPQAEHLLDRKPGDLLGRVLWEEYPGMVGSEFERAYRRVASERITLSATSYYPDHDRWYESHVYPATDGISVYFRDVSERKRSEAELARLTAQSEQQRRIYETALSNTADFNYVFDLEGRFVYVNQALLALWGREFHEAVGKNFFELDYPSDLAERLQRQIQAVIDTRQPLRDETPYTSALGQRQYEYIFMPVLTADGSVEAVAGSTRDITQRKQIETELQDARSRLNAALEAGAIATWTWDIPSNRLFTDENLAKLLNLDSSEAGGGLLDEYIKSIHPDDWPRVSAALNHSVESGEGYQADYRIIQSDRYVRWVAARGRVERDEAGRAVRMAGVLVDITDRKRLEEELRLRVEQLAEADRHKDEFLATLAHELRNPLAPIRTGLEVMKLAKDDPATVEDIRDTMERQTQQLIMLVDDLLDVSRITRGKLELRTCRVNLSEVMQSAVEASKSFIDELGHELSVTVPKPPIDLDADPHRLAQVLSNLLNNAAKYTPEGGRIGLTATRQGNDAVVSVTDTGIGIPADMLERIFEMFAQVDRPMEKGYTGLGIGLTLVKSLVEMQGGRVEVRSEGENQGSEFRVRLPILVEKSVGGGEADRDGQSAAVTNKRRVLVVDDNEAAATMLSMVVKMLGNDVRTAGDGQTGLEIAAEFLPDVVLMDIGMPRMDGYEAAHHIRQHSWGKNMMLVALTGWGQDEDKRRTREAGFDYHLTKPAEPSDLEKLFAESSGEPSR